MNLATGLCVCRHLVAVTSVAARCLLHRVAAAWRVGLNVLESSATDDGRLLYRDLNIIQMLNGNIFYGNSPNT